MAMLLGKEWSKNYFPGIHKIYWNLIGKQYPWYSKREFDDEVNYDNVEKIVEYTFHITLRIPI